MIHVLAQRPLRVSGACTKTPSYLWIRAVVEHKTPSHLENKDAVFLGLIVLHTPIHKPEVVTKQHCSASKPYLRVRTDAC